MRYGMEIDEADEDFVWTLQNLGSKYVPVSCLRPEQVLNFHFLLEERYVQASDI
jgi:hypothetical protein